MHISLGPALAGAVGVLGLLIASDASAADRYVDWNNRGGHSESYRDFDDDHRGGHRWQGREHRSGHRHLDRKHRTWHDWNSPYADRWQHRGFHRYLDRRHDRQHDRYERRHHRRHDRHDRRRGDRHWES